MSYVRRETLPNAVLITIGSRRRAFSRRLKLYWNDFGRRPTRSSMGPPLPFDPGPLNPSIGYALPDQDPMASPPCVMVVTILVLVMRGCCDGIWQAAVDAL